MTACKTGPRGPGNTGAPRGLIVTAAPVFQPLFSHALPAPAAVALGLAGFGAVGLPPLGDKGPSAYGTAPCFRPHGLPGQGGFEHRGQRQHRRPEVAAQAPRPPLAEHIAGTVQGETAIVAVIVGAHTRDQPPDRLSLVTGQLPAHHRFGPTWPEVLRGSTIRVRRFFLQSPPRSRQAGQGSGSCREGRGTCFIIRS